MIFPPGNYWTVQNAVQARALFGSDLWQKMLAVMMANKPKIKDGKSQEERYYKAVAAETWEDCMNMFASFGQDPVSQDEDRLDQIDPSTMSSKENE